MLINSTKPSIQSYRDDFRSRGRSTQQTEELGSAVLHGTPADGDPTAERAVSDPIGRLGRVALPPAFHYIS